MSLSFQFSPPSHEIYFIHCVLVKQRFMPPNKGRHDIFDGHKYINCTYFSKHKFVTSSLQTNINPIWHGIVYSYRLSHYWNIIKDLRKQDFLLLRGILSLRTFWAAHFSWDYIHEIHSRCNSQKQVHERGQLDRYISTI